MDAQEPRWDLIRHIRKQIAAGTYITPGKLRAAVGSLLAHNRPDGELVDDREDHGKVEGNPRRRL